MGQIRVCYAGTYPWRWEPFARYSWAMSEEIEPQVEIQEAIEADEGQVLPVEHWAPRSSQGVETPFALGTIYAFQDGLVLRLEGFRDPAKARAAAGLSE
jgi:hypothetical protein